MATKQAILVAGSVIVLCPHCGAEQPSPGNGSDLWLVTEIQNQQGKRTCNDCDEPYVLHVQNKIGLGV